ncbi:hypothetical protein OAG68_01040 [bacterium]|nr:hypothetical protein [bacterium]
MRILQNIGYYAAVLFNTMFAILSSVTLIGIVFITQPQQVMHDIPPSWWIPIMLIMIPTQFISQYLTWKTVFRGEIPSPLAISKNQPDILPLFRPAIAFVWFANFLIGFVIVVSLYKPGPGQNLGLGISLFILFITFALTTFMNVYLMLLVRTLTAKQETIQLIWHLRIVIDVAVAIVAIAYYKIAF